MMANLKTLDGISDAREELYNKLETGEITDSRALGMERVLRGQTELKAHVPIRLLGVVTKFKGHNAERYVAPLVRSLLKFTTGEDAVTAIEAPKT